MNTIHSYTNDQVLTDVYRGLSNRMLDTTLAWAKAG